MSSREEKRVKAIADYFAKKAPRSAAQADDSPEQSSAQASAAGESLSMDFSMAPKKKSKSSRTSFRRLSPSILNQVLMAAI